MSSPSPSPNIGLPRSEEQKPNPAPYPQAQLMTSEAARLHTRSSEDIMGPGALHMLRLAGLLPLPPASFTLLDTACGPGVVASALHAALPVTTLQSSTIICADISVPLVQVVRVRAATEGWVARVEARVLDAADTSQDLGDGAPLSREEEGRFGAVTCNFGMHVIPNPDGVLKDTLRLLAPGGIFACTTWHCDNVGWTDDLRAAFKALPFEAPFPNPVPMQTHAEGRWDDPDWILTHLTSFASGEQHFADIQVEVGENVSTVQDAQDWVGQFRGATRWIWGLWPEELRKEHGFEEVMQLVKERLEEVHAGQTGGWEVPWKYIVAVAQKSV